MKFENINVYNFENALRGMRNPKNSWHLSDSFFGFSTSNRTPVVPFEMNEEYGKYMYGNMILREDKENNIYEYALVGPKDHDLAMRLIAAGNEHRKFLRQIFVSIDISAPLYWWKEADTYKVATVANSTSTMHKITSAPIGLTSFEIDDFDLDVFDPMPIVSACENLRLKYLELKDSNPEQAAKVWKELIRWLPESWIQTRTWTANYETLRSIYAQRKNHKLTEWHSFCKMIEHLPYSDFITN